MLLSLCMLFGAMSGPQSEVCVAPSPGCYTVTFENRLSLTTSVIQGRVGDEVTYVDFIVVHGEGDTSDLITFTPMRGWQVFPETLEVEEDEYGTSEICAEALG